VRRRWAIEIEHALFAGSVGKEPIIIYRRLDGGLAGFEDCCPHRLLPPSMGYLHGDHFI